jgi:hypothetical protein
MTRLRLLLALLSALPSMVPLSGAIVILALAMVFAGFAVKVDVGTALIVTGALVLFLETWPAIIAARGKR